MTVITTSLFLLCLVLSFECGMSHEEEDTKMIEEILHGGQSIIAPFQEDYFGGTCRIQIDRDGWFQVYGNESEWPLWYAIPEPPASSSIEKCVFKLSRGGKLIAFNEDLRTGTRTRTYSTYRDNEQQAGDDDKRVNTFLLGISGDCSLGIYQQSKENDGNKRKQIWTNIHKSLHSGDRLFRFNLFADEERNRVMWHTGNGNLNVYRGIDLRAAYTGGVSWRGGPQRGPTVQNTFARFTLQGNINFHVFNQTSESVRIELYGQEPLVKGEDGFIPDGKTPYEIRLLSTGEPIMVKQSND